MIDIDDCWFDKFRSVAHLIKRLKFKREMTEFWRRGATQSADSDNLDWFENATEIHVVLVGSPMPALKVVLSAEHVSAEHHVNLRRIFEPVKIV